MFTPPNNSPESKGLVLVIDDDSEILDAFSGLLLMEHYECLTFSCGQTFLKFFQDGKLPVNTPVCILCDVKMPELDGLELQQQLLQKSGHIPLILMSGLSGAQEAVCAFRAGAFDFLIKPIDASQLLSVIAKAMAHSDHAKTELSERSYAQRKLNTLSEREREVAERVAKGMTNLGISLELGISVRTVKFHRQRVLEKLQVVGATGLVRLLDKA
jgi:FixJ family two-component response regulator